MSAGLVRIRTNRCRVQLERLWVSEINRVLKNSSMKPINLYEYGFLTIILNWRRGWTAQQDVHFARDGDLKGVPNVFGSSMFAAYSIYRNLTSSFDYSRGNHRL